MDDHIIDAIIFGTNCVKAQDKLLQTLKILSLQQCLSVVRHYESLKLHIQQIRPDKNINYLRRCHSGKKKGQGTQSNAGQSNLNQRECSQSHSRQGQNQNQQKTALLNKNQCYGCGQDCHQDKSECPAFGKSVVGAITLYLYVARFLTGEVHSDLNHEEDRHQLMN